MTHLSLADLAAVVAGSVAATTAVCAAVCKLLPVTEEGQGDEPRLFIPLAELDDRPGLLRVAPILIAAETRRWAEDPAPAALGPDTQANFRPSLSITTKGYR